MQPKPEKSTLILSSDLKAKRTFTFYLSLVTSLACASTEYFHQNISDIHPSQYPTLVKNFRIESERGVPEALNNLGAMYLKGMGVPRNQKKAREYFMLAAANNFPPAMYHLGLIFYRGLGAEKNLDTAKNWFERSAVLGDKEAQFFLGTILASDEYKSKNVSKALLWLEKAAENGVPAAQYNLAMLRFEQNNNGDFDETSLFWLEKASNNLHSESIFILTQIYSTQKHSDLKLRAIIPNLVILAEKGDERAQHRLGTLYFLGKGVENNPQEGEFWLKQAALAGLPKAQRDLAKIYLNSDHTTKTLEGLAWSNIYADAVKESKSEYAKDIKYLSSMKKKECLEIERYLRNMIALRSEVQNPTQNRSVK